MDVAAVDLWIIPTACGVASSRAADLLDAAEAARAARMRRPEDADRFRRGRATLRCILGNLLDRSPESVQFLNSSLGKPTLPDDPDLRFSWSGTADCWALATTRFGSVGVDIERHRTDLDWGAMAPLAFSLAETTLLDSDRAFLSLWCAKEAVLKAAGTGLHDGMTAIELLDADGHWRTQAVLPDGERFCLLQLDAGAGHAAALSVRGARTIALRQRRFNTEPDRNEHHG